MEPGRTRAVDRRSRAIAAPAIATGGIVLVADDYGLTNGVSRAIIELAEAGRISATSAMTTSPHWPSHATWAARTRGTLAIGLHLNLTLGAPLGAMPGFALGRQFPGIGHVTSAALRGATDRAEIAAEITRQLDAFESELGFAPDHIDGHQHVHALPGIRSALLEVLAARYATAKVRPLLRSPAEALTRIARRRRSAAKALTLAWLSRGFAQAASAGGFDCNVGFSGVTDFSAGTVTADFGDACSAAGPRHLVMCHPGFVDDELIRLDPVTERRQREFDALMRGEFPAEIWRPSRTPGGDPVDWAAAWSGTHAA
jgi:chitin disaccharide deacetylase